jgi:hypothetical protein
MSHDQRRFASSSHQRVGRVPSPGCAPEARGFGGTHVHHLNYGIFLLADVGACLLLGHPTDPMRRGVAVASSIRLALTFDEFGMWLTAVFG